MANDICLGDVVRIMHPGDRLMIEDLTGRVIFRKQAMYVKFSGISLDRKVDRLEPHTIVFTKKIRDKHLKETEGKVIPVDQITDFVFRDLEMLIYTKIKIK